MRPFEQGARVVLPHGLRLRPASTALRASKAAPTMTKGVEVLVQEVIAAITTDPWSTLVSVPSSRMTGVGDDGRPVEPIATGSEAGTVPSMPLPRPARGTR